MKKLIAISLFVVAIITAHVLTLRSVPSVIMTKAIAAMGKRGIPEYKFVLSEPVTLETQTIVRSSPDLAYSICLFDLSNGPVFVSGAKWHGYGSLTIFDGVTDAVYIASLDAADTNISGSVVLTMDDKFISKEHPVAILNKPKGIALIRRLAPSTALFERVQTLSELDLCSPLSATHK